ncbi:hypothetical protein ZOSMA_92G00520 [Zostera marina]|uniref:Uncharacterized protein n=1 Tax=Zostera marina TaxID=29655 RepID=A0A0K9NIW1_ZOSMR|nr:hypothetical protein ZOSMA_92G00520 [Zostera marina]
MFEKIKNNGGITTRALWIIFRKHDIHETCWASHQNHGVSSGGCACGRSRSGTR